MLGLSAIGQLALAEFPLVKKVVGWVERKFHDPAELEERIARQKDNTFGQRWYEEFREAQIELEAKAREAPKARRLKKIVKAVEQVPDAAVDYEPLVRALKGAKSATTAKETLELSWRIDAIVKEMIADAQDEEESIMLLLN